MTNLLCLRWTTAEASCWQIRTHLCGKLGDDMIFMELIDSWVHSLACARVNLWPTVCGSTSTSLGYSTFPDAHHNTVPVLVLVLLPRRPHPNIPRRLCRWSSRCSPVVVVYIFYTQGKNNDGSAAASSSFFVLFRCLSGCDRVLSLIFITPTKQSDTTSTHHQKIPSFSSASRAITICISCVSSRRSVDKVSGERKRSKP